MPKSDITSDICIPLAAAYNNYSLFYPVVVEGGCDYNGFPIIVHVFNYCLMNSQ